MSKEEARERERERASKITHSPDYVGIVLASTKVTKTQIKKFQSMTVVV